MIALVDLIDEHSDAIEYDLMRCGSRLRDFPDGGVTWRDLAVLVRQCQPESAIFKALNPHWQQSPELEFLRQMEHTLRVLVWQQTKDGATGRNEPELIPLPWDPEPDGVIRGDVMTMDEAADWLGWDVPISA